MVDVAELQNAIANEVGRALLRNENAHGRVSVHLPSLNRPEWPPDSNELRGELFLSAPRVSGFKDDDLRQLLGAVQEALVAGSVLGDRIACAELHQNGAIFNERHAELGDLCTLPATLTIEPVRDSA
jgi:hypothetical protein